MTQRLRLLSRLLRRTIRGTGSLLRPARPEHPGQSLLTRLRWKLVQPYKVAPGTRLVFHGEPAPNRIVVEVDESKPPLPYQPTILPDYTLVHESLEDKARPQTQEGV